ncbi:50S ribosomal protein L11 methyltransferase [Lactobacillus sp. M0398]|uniref:50S ribosomal protein L11 methyltransferase n=1 Tax=unclassified Lactobacillus TaxID=2620435 RepID=UPI0018DD2EDB|nr:MULTISPECIES: 50S ribosomal protein L11 methyltransferase [unclassified Lactobacillus]MBI0120252.1 50S ribosomal protein L11 methyltransferase [Lactobacillus sp. M0398]MBI0122400.1 50S ribosomal protein L11 methyltransferase [Lactobacillus sp. W8174]MBI0134536.1 50S ribosomal protein L11 methyltransferase [Lactobacillus sp. W8173]
MKLLIIKIETSHEVEDALNIYSQDVLHCLGTETRKRSDFEQAGWESDSTIVKLDEIKDLPEDLEFLAYFDMEQDKAELVKKYQKKLSELKSYGLKIGQAEVSASYIKDEDWNTVWQKFYHPIDFSRHLAIVPEWEQYKPAFKDQNIIKLDPGLAFGTGSHKTTQLALLGLEQILIKPETVCDVGTGSGILAIASSILGARSVLATDISDEAITAANENISLNNLTNIKVQKTNLLNKVKDKYDIIVANILAEILLDLIPELDEHLTSNGKVIFSGIDCDQIEKIKKALTANGFQIILSMQQGRWIGLIIERKDN